MANELFIDRNFTDASLATIERVNRIIADMAAQGYKLTVRQLFYQFVSRDWIVNTQTKYKWLAALIDDARKAGLVDWDGIEDRTRTLRGFIYPDADPASFIRSTLGNYYEDLWANQSTYCEVWVEKDALLGVVERAANRWRAPYFACRGYPSSSAMYEAGKRFAEQGATFGKECYLFYLGDHDPSGLDMTTSNGDLLQMYGQSEELGYHINIERLALNMDQVRQYNPPPNTAKESDKRSTRYIQQYGKVSWELDALEPRVIDRLISDAVEGIIDEDQWDTDKAEEKKNRAKLGLVADQWDDVMSHLHGARD